MNKTNNNTNNTAHISVTSHTFNKTEESNVTVGTKQLLLKIALLYYRVFYIKS